MSEMIIDLPIILDNRTHVPEAIIYQYLSPI